MSFYIEESSFRDRDGFVFFENQKVYRAIKPGYFDTWNSLLSSGLLRELTNSGKLVSFSQSEVPPGLGENALKVYEAEKIPFISYPSEWTFTQLKKAALLTLDLQISALEKGFSLKDASAFNVQFKGPQAIFIDILSFEFYEEGRPWTAYRQFCMHFLAPLLLYRHHVPGVRQLMGSSLDGIQLDVCSALLPYRSRFSLLTYTHIHLHARLQKKHGTTEKTDPSKLRLNKSRLLTMLRHMRDGIQQMSVHQKTTNWSSYYDDFSYSSEGFKAKSKFVAASLDAVRPLLCLDLGCNTGEFSELACGYSGHVIACDSDDQVVSKVQEKKMPKVLPLCIDLMDPTPARGWDHSERLSFFSRASQADCVLALALIHHLSIGGNVPFSHLAKLFSRFKGHLIIEFVPKDDPQVKKLMVSRKDIFEDYTIEKFISVFKDFFSIENSARLPDSGRQLFLMKRKMA